MTQERYCVDSNVLIASWHTVYPIDFFPSLWEKLCEKKAQLILLKPIFDEIKAGLLKVWLDTYSFSEQVVSFPKPVKATDTQELSLGLDEHHAIKPVEAGDIEEFSLELEGQYNIQEMTKGVNRKDLLLIAYAKKKKLPIVTNESRQDQAPKEKYNYKIPLVCEDQNVTCMNFVDLLRKLEIHI